MHFLGQILLKVALPGAISLVKDRLGLRLNLFDLRFLGIGILLLILVSEIVELQSLLSIHADQLLRRSLQHESNSCRERCADHNVGLQLALVLIKGPHLELWLVKGSRHQELLILLRSASGYQGARLLKLNDL